MAKAKSVDRPVRGNQPTRIEVLSPTFASLYVNDVNVMVSPWDFRLRLGQLEKVDSEKAEALVTVLADVRMSPQHLRKLVDVLSTQLDGYEATMGAIPRVPSDTE